MSSGFIKRLILDHPVYVCLYCGQWNGFGAQILTKIPWLGINFQEIYIATETCSWLHSMSSGFIKRLILDHPVYVCLYCGQSNGFGAQILTKNSMAFVWHSSHRLFIAHSQCPPFHTIRFQRSCYIIYKPIILISQRRINSNYIFHHHY